MTHFLRRLFALCLAAGAMFGANAAHAQWQGTWDTRYGEVKLQQTQKYVYGDYGSWGTIEGMASPDGKLLRGVYRRNDDGTWGYFEWKLSFPTYFEGRWQTSRLPVPIWNSRGTKWDGKRTSEANPSLRVYPYEAGAVSAIGGFLGRQERKYVDWMSQLSNTGSGGPRQVAEEKPRVHPWARQIPAFAKYHPDYRPRYLEVRLTEITIVNEASAAEIYGDASIFAACEKPVGSFTLQPFGGRSNKVFRVSREEARPGFGEANRHRVIPNQNMATIRFPINDDCLADPDARIAIQLQTNLAEKDNFRATDDRLGYQARKIYLDQLVRRGSTQGQGAVHIEQLGQREWRLWSQLTGLMATAAHVTMTVSLGS